MNVDKEQLKKDLETIMTIDNRELEGLENFLRAILDRFKSYNICYLENTEAKHED